MVVINRNAITYLDKDLRPSVEEDVVDVARVGLGRFGVPRSVFCYIDHLGYLAYGDRSTTNRAVKFIREFFPACYSELADLVYHMWRHGVVHEYKPTSLQASILGWKGGVEVLWLSTTHVRKRERGLHLLSLPIKGYSNSVYLVVNNFQLATDLLSAIDKLASVLRRNSALRLECDKRVKTVGAVRPASEIDNPARRRTIVQEVDNVWASRGGLIDIKGNVISPHSKESKT